MPGIILYHALLNNTLTSWMQYLIVSKMASVSPKSIQFSSIYGKFYKQDYMKFFRARLIRTMVLRSNCRNYMAPLAVHHISATFISCFPIPSFPLLLQCMYHDWLNALECVQ